MRIVIFAGMAAVLAACAGSPTPSAPQALVDRSALTVQELLIEEHDRLDASAALARARGVVVCPRTFRAAFFGGGEGGGCVLLARDAAGSWSSPAFYAMGSASFGFQAGIQDSQTLFLLMNDRAVEAVLRDQFKLGADASLAFATFGGSVEGATTTAFGADIMAFSRSRGLFAGLAVDGTVMNPQPEWNAAYYGRPIEPREIVVNMAAHNPGADPLRAALLRFGGQGSTAAAGPAPVAAAPASTGAAPRSQSASVSRQALPPPPR
jgi:lipid-binding SYLF domain-containing protein